MLAELRERVWAAPELQLRLQATLNRDDFVREVIALSASVGAPLTRDEVLAAMREGHLAWLVAGR